MNIFFCWPTVDSTFPRGDRRGAPSIILAGGDGLSRPSGQSRDVQGNCVAWQASPVRRGCAGQRWLGTLLKGTRAVRLHVISESSDGLGRPSGKSRGVAPLSVGERSQGTTVVSTSSLGGVRGALPLHLGGRRWLRSSPRGIARRGSPLRWEKGRS